MDEVEFYLIDLIREYFKESYEVLGIKPYRQLTLDMGGDDNAL